MANRFFQVVWVLSVLLLALATYSWVFNDDWLRGLDTFLVLGWPAFIGLIISFIGTGHIFYPGKR